MKENIGGGGGGGKEKNEKNASFHKYFHFSSYCLSYTFHKNVVIFRLVWKARLHPPPPSSKLKDFADDNLKFDKNCRKFFKHVENTVGKEEIACYEQFLLFPQCFQ